MTPAVQHSMPGWEYHEASPLCWCEPRRIERPGLVTWDHDAKVCKDGGEHEWSITAPVCVLCLTVHPLSVVPSVVQWP